MSSAVTPPPQPDDRQRGAAGRDTRDRPAAAPAGTAPTDTAGHHIDQREHQDLDQGRRDPRALVEQQKARFGGMKFGSCFFGWLTATGTAVLLTALLTAIGAGVGLGQGVTPEQAGSGAQANAQTVGIVGAIVLLVVILVAYYCGGYVAGRMARFNGARQGIGVWLWALIAAVVVAILSALAGARFNILSTLNGFPRIPIDEGTLTTGGIITAIAVAVAALLGAILGGLAGMRFHRKVDRATLPLDR